MINMKLVQLVTLIIFALETFLKYPHFSSPFLKKHFGMLPPKNFKLEKYVKLDSLSESAKTFLGACRIYEKTPF